MYVHMYMHICFVYTSRRERQRGTNVFLAIYANMSLAVIIICRTHAHAPGGLWHELVHPAGVRCDMVLHRAFRARHL